jgi:hypothetical protein
MTFCTPDAGSSEYPWESHEIQQSDFIYMTLIAFMRVRLSLAPLLQLISFHINTNNHDKER